MGSPSTKVIVVGAGAAGLMAALAALEHGAAVTLLSAAPPSRSRSASTREGINAEPDASGDAPQAHLAETLRAGAWLAHQAPVARMCEAAPGIVEMLARFGVLWDRTSEGWPRRTRTLGSGQKRAVTAGRATGVRVVGALSGQLLRAAAYDRAQRLCGWEFLSLLSGEGGECRGVVAQNLRNMEIKAFPADAVVMAAGGFEALYAQHAASCASDGAAIAACFRQGAWLANPEFVQFAPFAIAAADACSAVPDATVACGGAAFILRDGRPHFFLEEEAPGDVAKLTRDAAARAVWRALAECRETGAGPVRLDITQLDPDWVAERLEPYLDLCAGALTLDPREAPIDVFPAALRTLGGLWVDEGHATSVPGLFAAGGSACLYHGAGALGGNELLAALHGGRIAGVSAAAHAEGAAGRSEEVAASLLEAARNREEDRAAHLASQEGEENPHVIARELGELLSASAAIEREDRALSAALDRIEELRDRAAHARLLDRSQWCNAELSFLRRLVHRIDLAGIVFAAARARSESRGAHWKPAHPHRDDGTWLATTRVLWKDGEAKLDHTERVRCDVMKPEA
jgi:succinate dehydrogenase / fumarate reductase, flavoprotein subunit